jgi:hypothetical protein
MAQSHLSRLDPGSSGLETERQKGKWGVASLNEASTHHLMGVCPSPPGHMVGLHLPVSFALAVANEIRVGRIQAPRLSPCTPHVTTAFFLCLWWDVVILWDWMSHVEDGRPSDAWVPK